MFTFSKLRYLLTLTNNSRILTSYCKSLRFYSNSLQKTSTQFFEPQLVPKANSGNEILNSDADIFGNLKLPLEKKNRKKTNPRFKNAPNFDTDSHSDKYGTLSKTSVMPLDLSDTLEEDDSRALYPERKFKSPEAYLMQMKRLVRDKKLKEALELFPDMKRHNIKPRSGNYTFMIGACGRAGFTSMAFQLLKQMTDHRHRPTPATLTGLFNSCAECPFPDYGLKKTLYLKEKALQKNWLLTQPTYHAMIKSFGRCGDLEAAFEVVDEMKQAAITVDTETYSFLLMSCISNKEAGFTYAIEVWRKMRAKKLKPHITTFNLLLRAARDCDVGPQEISSLLLEHWSSYIKRPYGFKTNRSLPTSKTLRLQNPEFVTCIEAGKVESTKNESFEFVGKTAQKDKEENRTNVKVASTNSNEVSLQVVPNLLAARPIEGPTFHDLVQIKTASDRLSLIGNADGFLDMMRQFKVEPDIKTFSIILECIPSDTKIEHQLLDLMGMYRVKPDVDFFNLLIKKRNFRNSFSEAKNVLSLINKYNLAPDIVTFGVLALGCKKFKYGMMLLKDIDKLGYCPNIEIFGALIKNSTEVFDFHYVKTILDDMRNVGIHPNEKVSKMIDSLMQKSRQIIIDKERGKEVTHFLPSEFDKHFQDFCDFYFEYLKLQPVKQEEHPWEQYETDITFHIDNKQMI